MKIRDFKKIILNGKTFTSIDSRVSTSVNDCGFLTVDTLNTNIVSNNLVTYSLTNNIYCLQSGNILYNSAYVNNTRLINCSLSQDSVLSIPTYHTLTTNDKYLIINSDNQLANNLTVSTRNLYATVGNSTTEDFAYIPNKIFNNNTLYDVSYVNLSNSCNSVLIDNTKFTGTFNADNLSIMNCNSASINGTLNTINLTVNDFSKITLTSGNELNIKGNDNLTGSFLFNTIIAPDVRTINATCKGGYLSMNELNNISNVFSSNSLGTLEVSNLNLSSVGPSGLYGVTLTNVKNFNLNGSANINAFEKVSYSGELSFDTNATLNSSCFESATIGTLNVTNSTIQPYAFNGMSGELNVSDVKSVDVRAFQGVNGLNISFTDNATLNSYAFNSASFASSSILGSFDKIGNEAFENCNLKSADLTVNTIGRNIFDNVELESLKLINSELNVNDYVLSNLKTLNLSIATNDLTKTFSTNIENVNLHNVTFFTEAAFKDCSNLSSVDANLNEVNSSVFMNCSNMTEITLPVTKICDYGCYGCGLEKVELSECVEVGDNALNNNTDLKTVSLPKCSVGNIASGLSDDKKLQFVSIPLITGSLGNSVFKDATDLSLINIGVDKIGDAAFMNCRLSSSTFGEVKTIGNSAFENCNLTSISFTNISSLGNRAFANNSIVNVTLKGNFDWTNQSYDTINKIQGTDNYFYVTDSYPTFGSCDIDINAQSLGNTGFMPNAVSLTINKLEEINNLTSNVLSSNSILQNLSCPDVTRVNSNGLGFNISMTRFDADNLEVIGNSGLISCGLISEGNYSKLTSIGSGAFASCIKLSSVTIGTGANIGDVAFSSCAKLQSVVNDSLVSSLGNGAFSGCNKLSNASFSLNYVPNSCFAGCNNLTKSPMSNVTSIGGRAFLNCEELTGGININADSIPAYAFYSCSNLVSSNITISNVKTIGNNAFCYCSNFGNISLDNVENIGLSAFVKDTAADSIILQNVKTVTLSNAFKSCTNVIDFEIPNLSTNIDSYAFSDKKYLQTFVGNSVVRIDDGAFKSMSSLKSVGLSNVSYIANSAFAGDSKLTISNLNYPSLQVIGNSAFNGVANISTVSLDSLNYLGDGNFKSCNAKEIHMKSITNLGNNFCDGPNNKLSVLNVSNVASFADSQFASYSSLTTMSISNARIIGEKAFADCSALRLSHEYVYNIESIGNSAFENCNVEEIYISNSTGNLPSIGDHILRGNNNLFEFFFIGTDLGNNFGTETIFTNLRYVEIPNVKTLKDSIFKDYPGGGFSIDNVESIGNYAFANCTNCYLYKPTLNKLTHIGDYAFVNCRLRGISANNLTHIGDYAFSGNSNLDNFHADNFANSDGTNIGKGVFECCDMLDVLSLPNVKYLSGPFLSPGIRTSGTSTIESWLMELDFDNLETVPDSAFVSYQWLNNISMPKLKSIGKYAFSDDENINKITCSPSVIDDYAFADCFNMDIESDESGFLNNSNLTKLGEGAFRNCSMLSFLDFNNLVDVGKSIFGTSDNDMLKSITLASNGKITLSEGAFYGLNGLSSIVNDSNIVSINDSAFYNDSSLSGINLNSCEWIGKEAFYNCNKLSTLDVPIAKKIDVECCKNCSNLNSFVANSVSDVEKRTVNTTISNIAFTSVSYSNGYPFANCSSLNYFAMDSMTSICPSMLYGLNSVAYISMNGVKDFIQTCQTVSNGSLITITESPLKPTSAALMARDINANVPALVKLDISNNTHSILPSMFKDYTNLTSINCQIKTIGEAGFMNCSNLNANGIDLSNVVEIDASGLCNCSNISDVSVPNATSLGSDFILSSPVSFLSATNVTKFDFKNISKNKDFIIVNLSNVTDGICEKAFSVCVNLAIASLNNVSSIGSSAFAVCASLSTINASNVKMVDNGAFASCLSLESIDLPNVSVLSANAFSSCTNLQTAGISSVKTIGQNAFGDCSNLKCVNTDYENEINLPNCVEIDGDNFNSMSGISSINVPLISNINSNCFNSLVNVGKVEFKNLTYLYSSCLNDCSNLTFADIGKVSTLSTNNFSGGNLKTLIASNIESYLSDGTDVMSNLLSISSNLEYLDIRNVTGSFSVSGSTSPLSYLNVDSKTSIMLSSLTNLKEVHANGLIDVPDSCFAGDSNLSNVYISNATSLGKGCFSSCSSLNTMDNSNVKIIDASAFYRAGIQVANFSNVLTVHSSAFYSCTNLTSADLNNASIISNSAFAYARSLKSINMSNVEYIGSGAFNNCSVLDGIDSSLNISKCKTIDSYAFYACGSLTKVSAPNVISIDNGAFYNAGLCTADFPKCSIVSSNAFVNCTNLKDVNLPLLSTSTTSSTNIFSGCPNIENVTIPFNNQFCQLFTSASSVLSSVSLCSETSIDSAAFTSFSNLQAIEIPSVKTVGFSALADKTKLTKVVADNLISIDEGGFSNCGINNISLKSNVTVSYGAFANCYNMTNVTIDKCGTNIDAVAFNSCDILSNVIISTLECYSRGLFANDIALSSISIGVNNCSAVADSAFVNCAKLTSMDFNTCTSFGSDCFSGCSIVKRLGFGNTVSNMSVFDPMTTITALTINNIKTANSSDLSRFSKIISGEMPNVEYIGDCAFSSWTNLTSFVSTPSKISYIGSSAFANCKIRSASINNATVNDAAFVSDTMLNKVTIDHLDSTHFSGSGHFSSCRLLNNVSVGTLEYVPVKCFYSNTNLSTFTVSSNNLTNVDSSGFCSCIALSEIDLSKVKTVGNNGFCYCKKLTNISIPNCESLDSSGFISCGFSDVGKCDNLAYAGLKAFYSCTNLSSISASVLQFVEASLFGDCVNLTSVYIPKCSKINNNGFSNCTNLSEFEASNCGFVYSRAFYNCTALSKVNLINCGYLNSSVFQSCSNLKSVSLNTTITENIFSDASNFDKLCLSSNITSVSTIYTNVKNLEIPYVKKIESKAFVNLSNLTSVSFKPGTLTSIGASAFSKCGIKNDIALIDMTVDTSAFLFASLSNVYIQDLTDKYFPLGGFYSCSMQNLTIANAYEIPNWCFIFCHQLSNISIYNNQITKISDNAFMGATNLPSFSAPLCSVYGLNCFNQCFALKEITLGEIPPNKIFVNDTNLTKISLEIPTVIDSFMFNASFSNDGTNNYYTQSTQIKEFYGTNIQTVDSYAFYSLYNMTKCELKPSVKYIGNCGFYSAGINSFSFCDSVTVGVSAFKYCTNLTAVTIQTLNTNNFSNDVFARCYNLQSVTIKEIQRIADKMFYCCSGLSIFNYPFTTPCLYIGNSAFLNCSNLNKAMFTNCKTIGSYAFSSCKGLSTVAFDNCVTYGAGCFNDCVNLSNFSLNTTTTHIFDNCTNLTALSFKCAGVLTDLDLFNISSSYNAGLFSFTRSTQLVKISGEQVTALADSMCFSLTNLKSAYFNDCNTIGNYCFSNCVNLESLNLANCTGFGTKCCGLCNHLKSLAIYDLTTTGMFLNEVDSAQFSDCTNIKYLTINPTYTTKTFNLSHMLYSSSIDDSGRTSYFIVQFSDIYLGGYNLINYSCFNNLTDLTKIECRDATYIGNNCFADCSNLKIAIFPSILQSVRAGAFYNCSNLSSLNLSYVLTIGNKCFYNCANLSEVNFSAIVNNVGTYAFASCLNLSHVSFVHNPGTSFYTIGCVGSLFYYCPKLTFIDFGQFSPSSLISKQALYSCNPLSIKLYETCSNTSDFTNWTTFITRSINKLFFKYLTESTYFTNTVTISLYAPCMTAESLSNSSSTSFTYHP